MPDRRHHDPHVKRKLVGAALLKELALEEHAGSFAKLDNGASHAFLSERKMRRGIERNRVEVLDVTDLVLALCPGVLASHHIAAEIDGDCVLPVHAALLPEAINAAAPLDRLVELVDTVSEPKGVGVACQDLKHRLREASELDWLKASCAERARLADRLAQWSRGHHNRVTVSDGSISGRKGGELAKGIIVGFWDGAELSEARRDGDSGN